MSCNSIGNPTEAVIATTASADIVAASLAITTISAVIAAATCDASSVSYIIVAT